MAKMCAASQFPPTLQAAVATARTTMLESLAMYSDELMELLLSEEEVPHAADPQRVA